MRFLQRFYICYNKDAFNMAFSQFTLAFFISMGAAVASIIVGAVGRREFRNITIISVVVFCFIIPIAFHFVYLGLETYVSILDWPIEAGSFLGLWTPLTAILIASWLGGILGMISGRYWGEGDRSCFQCLLGPIIVLFLISIVILVLP